MADETNQKSMKAKMKQIDTGKIAIEKGVPKPSYSNGHNVNKWFYVFVKMQINDSFAMPFSDVKDADRIRGAVSSAVRTYKKSHSESFVLTSRILFNKKEIRFWRDR